MFRVCSTTLMNESRNEDKNLVGMGLEISFFLEKRTRCTFLRKGSTWVRREGMALEWNPNRHLFQPNQRFMEWFEDGCSGHENEEGKEEDLLSCFLSRVRERKRIPFLRFPSSSSSTLPLSASISLRKEVKKRDIE